MDIDALCVEDRLLLARLGGGFTEQTACESPGLHDDSVLGQCCQE